MESNADSLSASTTTTTPVNVSPATALANLLLSEIKTDDVSNLLNVQRSLLQQLDKTNEKIDGINKLSAKRYLDASRDFSSHTQILTTMKSDLDLIFKRIKQLKIRLNKKYPEAYTTVLRANAAQNPSVDDEEDDMSDLVTSTRSAANPSLVKSKTMDCSQLSRGSYDAASLPNSETNASVPKSMEK